LRQQFVELGAAAPCPGDGAAHGKLLHRRRVVDVSAIVETHHDVGAVAELQLHALFGRQLDFAIHALRLHDNAVVGECAEFGLFTDQGVRLKAARIGEDRPSPAAQGVETAQRLDRRGAGLLHQVEGVHHQRGDARRLDIGAVHGAHNAQRGVRQKSRERQDAVRQVEVGGIVTSHL
jgi:hypothetical protein